MSKQIGKKIKEAREQKRLTQEEVASRLGIGRAGLANIETGRNLITVDHLIKLPAVLQKPITFFLDIGSELSQEEQELVELYRSLPEGLPRDWIMFLVREWVQKMDTDWEDFVRRNKK